MLAQLAAGEASVNELAAPFEMSLPAISRHIKVLEQAGLITQGRRAQYRPCELNAEPLQHISSWVEQYRTVWETSFDRLENYLDELSQTPNEPKEDTR